MCSCLRPSGDGPTDFGDGSRVCRRATLFLSVWTTADSLVWDTQRPPVPSEDTAVPPQLGLPAPVVLGEERVSRCPSRPPIPFGVTRPEVSFGRSDRALTCRRRRDLSNAHRVVSSDVSAAGVTLPSVPVSGGGGVGLEEGPPFLSRLSTRCVGRGSVRPSTMDS